jgi:hypothetical protein
MGAIRNKDPARYVNTSLVKHGKFAKQRRWIDHHARAQNHNLIGVQNPGRNQMQRVLLIAYNYGMPRVCSACVPDDYLRLVRKIIHDFAFAFIAPLSADYYYFHCLPLYGEWRMGGVRNFYPKFLENQPQGA